jgi:hypothetical protein
MMRAKTATIAHSFLSKLAAAGASILQVVWIVGVMILTLLFFVYLAFTRPIDYPST